MKVAHLQLNNYNQFKNFELDLTYPTGHAKAGQPLDKVCIIGQSGTGKTSLLLFLKNLWGFLIEAEFYSDNEELRLRKYANFLPKEFRASFLNTKKIEILLSQTSSSDLIESIRFLKKEDLDANILYFSTEVELQTWGATQLTFTDFWFRIAQDIQKYQELEIQKRIELSKIIEGDSSNELLQQGRNDFAKWKQNNPNPLDDIADKLLDTVLNRFNLQVKRDLSFKKDDIGTIRIETLQGEEVPFNCWSTGTKQLITRVLPLYAMRPENYLLLFDEPEQSLYPDIQTEIIDILTSSRLSTDCQFFFATHSPLIASCFEPWEIVELKFNPDGSVYRELYYDIKKGNHIDNYTIDPRYLRWDSILTRLFDLDKDSNEARTRKLMELATLRSKLQKANGKLPPEEKVQLQSQFEKLAELLDWEYDAKN
jgi:AAA15 family ATPase/GTPase